MILLSRRALFAVAAVVDVALHARPAPVTAGALAARHELPARHLETVLQVLVRTGILKGTRGPRGGYELGRDRRRVTVGDIVRAVESADPDSSGSSRGRAAAGWSDLVAGVVVPAVASAGSVFLERLDEISVEDLCRKAVQPAGESLGDFTI